MSKIITNNITPRSGSSVGLTGGLNVTGNVSVGGTITYEDVTNVDSVGVITARSDVSIADKIIHTGDTNTAIRFPAVDTFTVETAGSERLRVTSDGKFGFKTTSPDYTVDINGEVGITEGQPVTWHNGSGSPSAQIFGDSSDNLIFRNTSSGVERLRITSGGAAIFKAGLAEKYANAGTTLGSQSNNSLSNGNVILFTGNESGNKTINFTGVHSTLSNGETVSFTAIITPNNSGVINVVQVDGQAITIKWSGGSAPSAGSSGQDIYTFQILKTGTGVSDYTVYGAATNYA